MITATETKLPHIKTSLPGPKSKKVIEYDAKYISPSLSRVYPMVAERGSGAAPGFHPSAPAYITKKL